MDTARNPERSNETAPQDAPTRRRTFTLIPFDSRGTVPATPEAAVELGYEVIEAGEPVDWKLRRWLWLEDERRLARERLVAAEAVVKFYETQAEALSEFLLGESRDELVALVEREHHGKSRYTDHALKGCGRADLVVRVGLRKLQPAVNVYDEELLISSFKDQIEGPGQLKEGATAPLRWVPPREGHWELDKRALAALVKDDDNLPGVELIPKPEAIYLVDKSREGGK